MSVYLKQFSTHAEYDAYINGSGAILPNVSICTTEGDVHYNPFDPYARHEYVEIGGLKWATMNVGAEKVTDAGLYFQWGDAQGYTASQCGSGEGQKYFSWEDYKYDSGGTWVKYDGNDGLTVLELSDDAARTNWGGSWRMPTTAEFIALGAATTSAWTANYEGSGVAGLVLTSKADSSKKLFFPAAGMCSQGSVIYTPPTGYYWSSSLNNLYVGNANYMLCALGGIDYSQFGIGREPGLQVRAVLG